MVLTMVDWSARKVHSSGDGNGLRAQSRAIFGPNGVQLAVLLDILERSNAETWKAIVGAHLLAQGEHESDREAYQRQVGQLIGLAARRGVSLGAIVQEQMRQATREAEEVAQRGSALLVAHPAFNSADPRQLEAFAAEALRSFANMTATLLVVRPFFDAGDFERLWAPYAGVLPLFALSSE
jgi:hypothetical protein